MVSRTSRVIYQTLQGSVADPARQVACPSSGRRLIYAMHMSVITRAVAREIEEEVKAPLLALRDQAMAALPAEASPRHSAHFRAGAQAADA